MIIPIRCVSCNDIIAGKWLSYLKLVKELKKDTNQTEYLAITTTKTAEGKAMDELKITRVCCRRHFLTHVDLI